jgi:hypothetical protein
MRSYWGQKFKIRRRIAEDEWHLMKKINSKHLEWEHLFAVKYAAGLLPTQSNMVRRKHAINDICPCCPQREDTDHLLQCTADLQKKLYDDLTGTMRKNLLNITSWEVAGALLEVLSSFREKRPPRTHHNWKNNVAKAVATQYELGQRAFISGMWVKQWTNKQDKFQTTQRSRKKGISVIALMIQKVQRLVREMWYNHNNQLHNNEQSRINKERLTKNERKINNIYDRKKLIPLGLLAPGDRKFFRQHKQSIQRMRLISKERWVRDAEMILHKYDTENNTEQIRQFRSYFMHRDDG